MISVRFQGKPFNSMVIQAYAPTSNAEEAEVERFYEDLQDLLELTPKKAVVFIIGDWNAKVERQWGRKWQPTAVFLPGKVHGQRSLAGCSPWGYMTEHVCTRVEGDRLVAIKW